MSRKVTLSLAVLFTILSLATTSPAATVFFDDFNGDALGPAWTVLHPNPATYSVSGSQLHTVTCPGDLYNGLNNYENLFLISNPLGSGDFRVTMKVANFHPNSNNQQIHIIVYDNDDNYVKSGNAYSNYPGGQGQFWHLGREIGGNWSWVLNPANATQADFWIRVEKKGNIYRHYYSLDGVTYLRVLSDIAYGNGAPQYLGLLASDGQTSQVPVDIDFFQVESLPASGTNFSDTFDGTALKPEWLVLHEDTAVYSLSGGQLHTSTQPGDLWEGTNDYKNLFLIKNPMGNGDFRVTLRALGFNPSINHQQLLIVAYDDDNNHVRTGNMWADGRFWTMGIEIGGVIVTGGSVNTDAAVPDFYLRLEKLRNTYSLYTSLDGVNYQKRVGPFTYGNGAPKYLGFMAFEGSGNPNPPTPVNIDSFAVERILLPPGLPLLLLD